MIRPSIDDRHRIKRRQLLEQFNLGPNPDTRELMDVTREFGPQPFNVNDLYDFYLYDFIKTLPPEHANSLS